MRGYNDELGQAFAECDHTEQVLARALGIQIRELPDEPIALLALCDAFELPDKVANKGIACTIVKGHEDNHAAGGVTRGGDNDNRAVTIDVVAFGKAEIGATFEAVLLVPYAGEGFAELSVAFVSSVDYDVATIKAISG